MITKSARLTTGVGTRTLMPPKMPSSAGSALAAAIEADAHATKAIMYRDAYGNTWDGQGDKPDWLARAIYAGQNIEHFRC